MKTKKSMLKNIEDIMNRLAMNNLSTFKKEDILAFFEHFEIRSLDDFAAKIEQSNTRYQVNASKINLSSILEIGQNLKPFPSIHKVPKVPFLFEGQLYESKDIVRFNNTELHSILTHDKDGREIIATFKEKQKIFDLMRVIYISSIVSVTKTANYYTGYGYTSPFMPFPPNDPNPISQTGPGPGVPNFIPSDKEQREQNDKEECNRRMMWYKDNIRFFEHINFGGDWFWLGARQIWPDLTKVGRSKFILFNTADWNDTVSSIHGTSCAYTIYEHINQQGSSMSFLGSAGPKLDPTSYPSDCKWNHTTNNLLHDLGAFGWNDRISSIVNWG